LLLISSSLLTTWFLNQIVNFKALNDSFNGYSQGITQLSFQIYKESDLIENKNWSYLFKIINDVSGNNPELLIRAIKLYKKWNNILCEAEGKVKDLLSLENCTSFIIDGY